MTLFRIALYISPGNLQGSALIFLTIREGGTSEIQFKVGIEKYLLTSGKYWPFKDGHKIKAIVIWVLLKLQI